MSCDHGLGGVVPFYIDWLDSAPHPSESAIPSGGGAISGASLSITLPPTAQAARRLIEAVEEITVQEGEKPAAELVLQADGVGAVKFASDKMPGLQF